MFYVVNTAQLQCYVNIVAIFDVTFAIFIMIKYDGEESLHNSKKNEICSKELHEDNGTFTDSKEILHDVNYRSLAGW